MKILQHIRYSISAGLIILLPLTEIHAQQGIYPIKNYGPEEYLAGIQNIDFAQNRNMNLFVANNLGILSYDGSSWETHAYRNGKKQRSLVFDPSMNRLYVGSQGDFGYYEGNWEYTSLVDLIPDELKFDEVWDVFLLNSEVFFCTFQAIFVYNGSTIKVISNNGGFNKSFLSGNQLFTQNQQGQLFEVSDFRLKAGLDQNQRDMIVSGIINTDKGHLVFYNSGEIELSNTLEVMRIYPELIRKLTGTYVNHVLQLSDSRLVISTQTAGLFLFDLQTEEIENISSINGLRSDACLRAFQDHSGNLWVGMQNGLALIDINSPIRLIGKEINIQGSGYEAYQHTNGIYYSTSNGIYYLPNGAERCIFLAGTEGPAYGMTMINEKLYAGHHTGLFSLENGIAKRIVETNGLWKIKRLRSDPSIVIGGTYTGLHLFRINEQNAIISVGNVSGFAESSRFFEEDLSGNLWVSQYYKGLYKLQFDEAYGNVKTKHVTQPELPINQYVILSQINNKLFLTSTAGVYQIDTDTDQITKTKFFNGKLSEQWIYLLTQDKSQNVHVFSENNVGYYKQVSKNNYLFVPSSLYRLRHSFNNDLLHVSTQVNDGVYFNSNEGFIYYNPVADNQLNIDKKPVVNSIFSIDEDTVFFARKPFEDAVAQSNKLAFKEVQDLHFTVESFKFKSIEDQKFRYYLEGFDKYYSDWTTTASKEYTNLPAGEYQFYAQTENIIGEPVTSDPIGITVHPPFFKSSWMKLIYVLTGIILVGMLYRFQRYRYKGKERKIKQDKQQELDQKQRELQHLKEEKIQSELRHVNNLLAASTMNLVVKNEFMENIKQELNEVSQGGAATETKKSLERIIKEIDSTLKLQEDWKQFEYHFDKVHGDFLTRLTTEFIDLTPGEQKLAAFLRLKMDTKEIANLMGVSIRGVEVARYRLRKKLGLDKHQNLSKYILEY